MDHDFFCNFYPQFNQADLLFQEILQLRHNCSAEKISEFLDIANNLISNIKQFGWQIQQFLIKTKHGILQESDSKKSLIKIICCNLSFWDEVEQRVIDRINSGKEFFPMDTTQFSTFVTEMKQVVTMGVDHIMDRFDFPKIIKSLIEIQIIQESPVILINDPNGSFFVNIHMLSNRNNLLDFYKFLQLETLEQFAEIPKHKNLLFGASDSFFTRNQDFSKEKTSSSDVFIDTKFMKEAWNLDFDILDLDPEYQNFPRKSHITEFPDFLKNIIRQIFFKKICIHKKFKLASLLKLNSNENENQEMEIENENENGNQNQIFKKLSNYHVDTLYSIAQINNLLEFSSKYQEECGVFSCGSTREIHFGKHPWYCGDISRRSLLAETQDLQIIPGYCAITNIYAEYTADPLVLSHSTYPDNDIVEPMIQHQNPQEFADFEQGDFNETAMTNSLDQEDINVQTLTSSLENKEYNTQSYVDPKSGTSHYRLPQPTGITAITRSPKFSPITAETIANDLTVLIQRIAKPAITIIANSGDFNLDPSSNLALLYLGRVWRDTALDVLNVISYSPNSDTSDFQYNIIDSITSSIADQLGDFELSVKYMNEEVPPFLQKHLFTKKEIEKKEKIIFDTNLIALSNFWQSLKFNGTTIKSRHIACSDKPYPYDDYKNVRLFLASPTSKISTTKKLNSVKKELEFLLKHTYRSNYFLSFCRCNYKSCPHCSQFPLRAPRSIDFLRKFSPVIFSPIPSMKRFGRYSTFVEQTSIVDRSFIIDEFLPSKIFSEQNYEENIKEFIKEIKKEIKKENYEENIKEIKKENIKEIKKENIKEIKKENYEDEDEDENYENYEDENENYENEDEDENYENENEENENENEENENIQQIPNFTHFYCKATFQKDHRTCGYMSTSEADFNRHINLFHSHRAAKIRKKRMPNPTTTTIKPEKKKKKKKTKFRCTFVINPQTNELCNKIFQTSWELRKHKIAQKHVLDRGRPKKHF
ncbi:a-type inclusion protein [Anaeramoeba ignava]|uniref:A-type inclusion protein n=1 Tax=Anaeramoeba ignava TaxID=1746090 RepID=A0A9Q0LJ70_ANAIG|nr:a-type inclusion protein [Anaeramoeba ignava]